MSRALRAKSASISLHEMLEGSPWFATIDDEARQVVLRDTLERAVAAGDALGWYGETQRYWFGVIDGLLKWSINSADGRTVTLGGQAAGSWFGEGTLLRGQPRKSDLVALRHSRVALLPFDTFDWLRKKEPAFNEFLLRQINERMHWFMGSFAAHRLLDTDRFIARTLVGLVHPLLNPSGERYLQISQEELANLATVSRQRCNETLVSLKRMGLIEIEYGAVRILKLQELQDMAG